MTQSANRQMERSASASDVGPFMTCNEAQAPPFDLVDEALHGLCEGRGDPTQAEPLATSPSKFWRFRAAIISG